MCERGIDVSDNNQSPGTEIDWASVSSRGFSYAYIKATQGGGYVSPALDSQWHGARGVGITAGLYHFANTGNNPASDAQNFASVVQEYKANLPGCLPPCLDIESRCLNPNLWVYTFITTYWQLVGRVSPVVLYAPANWWATGYLHDDWAPEVSYWVASWGTPPGHPSWTSPKVVNHQFTSTGSTSGISGPVDLDCSVQPIASWMVTV